MTVDLKKSVDDLVEQTLVNLDTEVVETAVVVEEVIVKSEDKDEPKDDEDKDPKDKDDKKKKDAKKDDDKPAFMKSEPTVIRKSMEELSSILTADELQVIEAWRDEIASETVEEEIVKSEPAPEADLVKSIRESMAAEFADIRKSLNDKDDLIKSLNTRLETVLAQPAHAPKSISDLSIIEKSQEAPTLTKSKVLDTMFDLLKSGAGVSSLHIAEFETKGTISNQNVRKLVADACQKS